MTAVDHHAYPVGDLVDHDMERDCWCGPRLYIPCDCDDVEPFLFTNGMPRPPAGRGCWKCEGGVIEVEIGWEGNCMVTHNAADGRE